jgi:hypothetical protein
MTKKKDSIFSKENNTALYGELGQKNLKGCLYLLIFFIIILICMAINEPSFFHNLGK